MIRMSKDPMQNAKMFAYYYENYLLPASGGDPEKILRYHMGKGKKVTRNTLTNTALNQKIKAYNYAKTMTGQEPTSVDINGVTVSSASPVIPKHESGGNVTPKALSDIEKEIKKTPNLNVPEANIIHNTSINLTTPSKKVAEVTPMVNPEMPKTASITEFTNLNNVA
jgi:hypothetical protein